MHEIDTPMKQVIFDNAEEIRSELAKRVVMIAIKAGPRDGVAVSAMSVAEGCAKSLKDLYDTLLQVYADTPHGTKAAALFAETVMVGLAETFQSTLNVSVVRRDA